jgi:hypothetical protein
LSELDVLPPRGLPDQLPEGERILWQRSPEWRPFARRVFQLYKAALYFALLIVWVAGAAWMDTGSAASAFQSLVWTVPPAIGVIAILALLGWAYARSTIYTVTNQRVVILSGLAIPASINLPFSRIQSAGLNRHADGSGDIELELTGDRVLYTMLWPNLRLFRITRPRPVLRGLSDPQQAADSLGQALSRAHQPDPETAEGETADPSGRQRAMTA